MESSVNRVIQQFGLDPATITEQVQSGKVSVQDAVFKAVENYYYITGGQLPTKEEVAKLVSAVDKVYQDRGFLQKLSENVDPTTAVGVAAAMLLTTLGVKGLQKKFLKRSAQKVIKGEAKAATKEVETAVRKTRFQEQTTKPGTTQDLGGTAHTGGDVQPGKPGGWGREPMLTSDTIAQEGGTELKALSKYEQKAPPPAKLKRQPPPSEVQTAVHKAVKKSYYGIDGKSAEELDKLLNTGKAKRPDLREQTIETVTKKAQHFKKTGFLKDAEQVLQEKTPVFGKRTSKYDARAARQVTEARQRQAIQSIADILQQAQLALRKPAFSRTAEEKFVIDILQKFRADGGYKMLNKLTDSKVPKEKAERVLQEIVDWFETHVFEAKTRGVSTQEYITQKLRKELTK